MKKTFFLIMGLVLYQSICCSNLYSQINTPSPQSENKPENMPVLDTLSSVLQTIQIIKAEIKQAEADLKKTQIAEEKKALEQKIDQLNSRFKSLDRDFENISAGIDIALFEETPKKEFDIKSEVLELVSPLINELKGMTERPRQIDRLRKEINTLESRQEITQNSTKNIRNLLSKTEDAQMKIKLTEMEKRWNSREQQVESQLTVLRYQLNEKTKDKRPFLVSSQELVKVFFKTRGKNLFLAIMAFLFVFLIMRLLYRYFVEISPLHKPERRSIYIRVFDVAYQFLTYLMSLLSLMAIFYISGDWVLLSVFIIFLLGAAWTAKQGLSQFWEEIRIVLNLGMAKEGERIIYNGIPWRVDSIGFYCVLANPELSTGKIRLPLKFMIGIISRPCHANEPWFPSSVGDWIILSDGTFGQVTLQTPEMVILKLLGGSSKTIVTEDFIRTNPINLSHNFRINITFGIDYAHQAECTKEIPQKMAVMIKEGLSREGYGDKVINLKVEFSAAASSSLDYHIIGDFDGKSACHYNRLTRTLNRMAVEACNRYGWNIPFTQVTIHSAGDHKRIEELEIR